MNLVHRFNKIIVDLGLGVLEHPMSSRAPFVLCFQVGGEEDVYKKKGLFRKEYANPQYVQEALERASTLFHVLSSNRWLLRIDCLSEEEMKRICKHLQLRRPKELVKKEYGLEGDDITHYEMYWDLREENLSIDRLLKEIILADLGGLKSLASNVFLINEADTILYLLHDDRAVDIVAENKEALFTLYSTYQEWLLPFNNEGIFDCQREV